MKEIIIAFVGMLVGGTVALMTLSACAYGSYTEEIQRLGLVINKLNRALDKACLHIYHNIPVYFNEFESIDDVKERLMEDD